MIRLYGVDHNEGSLARVSKGAQQGLEAIGKLAGFFELSIVSEQDTLGQGFDAPVGVSFGPPISASAMVGRGEHRERLQLVAANSSWLPKETMLKLGRYATGIIAPTSWAASVIREHTKLPVYVWQHGVDEGLIPQDVVKDGEFSVLHLASTHMQRKGTRELIYGWARAVEQGWIPEKSELKLVVDGPRGYFLSTIHKASRGLIKVADTIDQLPRLNLPIDELRWYYNRFHLVAQPSRGEGFGLVPLEARACGVPVLTTTCTGHADHIHKDAPGVVTVPHGPEDVVDDGPGAMLPTVPIEGIAEGLKYAYENRERLQQEARGVADQVRDLWSWRTVTERFVADSGLL